MSDGQFEKLKIYAYKKDDFAEREAEFIEAMMNPENFSFESKMEFQAAQGQGTQPHRQNS